MTACPRQLFQFIHIQLLLVSLLDSLCLRSFGVGPVWSNCHFEQVSYILQVEICYLLLLPPQYIWPMTTPSKPLLLDFLLYLSHLHSSPSVFILYVTQVISYPLQHHLHLLCSLPHVLYPATLNTFPFLRVESLQSQSTPRGFFQYLDPFCASQNASHIMLHSCFCN